MAIAKRSQFVLAIQGAVRVEESLWLEQLRLRVYTFIETHGTLTLNKVVNVGIAGLKKRNLLQVWKNNRAFGDEVAVFW